MAFLDWLAPYIEPDVEFIGYYKWSDDTGPHLLYCLNGALCGTREPVLPSLAELHKPNRYEEDEDNGESGG